MLCDHILPAFKRQNSSNSVIAPTTPPHLSTHSFVPEIQKSGNQSALSVLQHFLFNFFFIQIGFTIVQIDKMQCQVYTAQTWLYYLYSALWWFLKISCLLTNTQFLQMRLRNLAFFSRGGEGSQRSFTAHLIPRFIECQWWLHFFPKKEQWQAA